MAKPSCWDHWPFFDAQAAIRAMGDWRRGRGKHALRMLSELAQEMGHEVALVDRQVRTLSGRFIDDQPGAVDFTTKQDRFALAWGGRLFFMSGADSWERDLLDFHRICGVNLEEQVRMDTHWSMGHRGVGIASTGDGAGAGQAREQARAVARKTRRDPAQASPAPAQSFPWDGHPGHVTVFWNAGESPESPSTHIEALMDALRQLGWDVAGEEITQVQRLDGDGSWPDGVVRQVVRRSWCVQADNLVIHCPGQGQGRALVVEATRNPDLLTAPGVAPMAGHPQDLGGMDAIVSRLTQIRLGLNLDPGGNGARPRGRM